MSHGAGGDGGVRADPDLTPMLDLVMQLLMYFIMCANFLGEQVNENIHLPDSQAAKPLTKETDILFMNINREGKVLVLGQDPMNMEDTTKWLNDRASEANKDDKGRPKTAIIIRADSGADYASIYELLELCKKKDFNQFRVRANIASEG